MNENEDDVFESVLHIWLVGFKCTGVDYHIIFLLASQYFTTISFV